MSGLSFRELEFQHKRGEMQEESQFLTYEREREAKAPSAQERVAKKGTEGEAFLRYVAEGEQDKAEMLLRDNSSLVLYKGVVIDLSKRVFKSMTGFQYALWASDWYMGEMLLMYMPKEIAALQLIELEEKETEHGKYFSLSPLVEVLDAYIKKHDVWNSAQCTQYWCRAVGGQQRLLPVHIVNEYCHPTRGFCPCPRFDEAELRRSRRCNKGDWFSCEFNGGGLGETFAIQRSPGSVCAAKAMTNPIAYYVAQDLQALQSLWKIRQQQFGNLKIELRYFIDAKELLNVYFPSVLSSAIIKYLG